MVKESAMKTCGMELKHHIFLTSTLDGQWSAACFHSFTLTKNLKMSDVQYGHVPVVAKGNSLTLPGIEPPPTSSHFIP
jgi:hypothetical protein